MLICVCLHILKGQPSNKHWMLQTNKNHPLTKGCPENQSFLEKYIVIVFQRLPTPNSWQGRHVRSLWGWYPPVIKHGNGKSRALEKSTNSITNCPLPCLITGG